MGSLKVTYCSFKPIYSSPCPGLSLPLSLFRYTDLPIEDYLCPVLRGCTVCVTGLSTVERKEVQRLCQQHGASYTGQLKMNECTHLIVSEPSGRSNLPYLLLYNLGSESVQHTSITNTKTLSRDKYSFSHTYIFLHNHKDSLHASALSF